MIGALLDHVQFNGAGLLLLVAVVCVLVHDLAVADDSELAR